MHASRAVLIFACLAAPKTAQTSYVFAAGLGLTCLAKVPPTATDVGKLFGGRHLATLLCLKLLLHQTGGFLGAWLGGITTENLGDCTLMCYLDAALINLPIREPHIALTLRTASSRCVCGRGITDTYYFDAIA